MWGTESTTDLQRVLIVDDDEAVRKVLGKVVASRGMEPCYASDGNQALSLILASPCAYQVILLDIMLGEPDGFSVLRHIRQHHIYVPVMIISSCIEDVDTLYGLGLGADDYITKPFNPVVLGAKIQALIRRSQLSSPATRQLLEAGSFRLDTHHKRFFRGGKEQFLSGKEFALMQLFMEHPRQVFSKEDLYRNVWGDIAVDDNTIMVYINRLRAKIEANPKTPTHLVTVWGVGYSFEP